MGSDLVTLHVRAQTFLICLFTILKLMAIVQADSLSEHQVNSSNLNSLTASDPSLPTTVSSDYEKSKLGDSGGSKSGDSDGLKPGDSDGLKKGNSDGLLPRESDVLLPRESDGLLPFERDGLKPGDSDGLSLVTSEYLEELKSRESENAIRPRTRNSRKATLPSTRRGVNSRDNIHNVGVICPPKCDPSMCHPRKASQLICKGSVIPDTCGCCHRCAKLETETCGGVFEYQGRCDTGLACMPSNPPGLALNKVSADQQAGMLAKNQRKNVVPVAVKDFEAMWSLEGVCRKAEDLAANNKPEKVKRASSCQPKCTRSYCRQNPKSICSAADDRAERERTCRAPCQHTSCRACKTVMADPAALCGTCRRDDRGCMQRFGRCVRKLLCNDTKSACNLKHLKLLKKEKDVALKFQCFVPGCPVTL